MKNRKIICASNEGAKGINPLSNPPRGKPPGTPKGRVYYHIKGEI